MKQSIIVVGAGGHASVVADAILVSGSNIIGFTDSDPCRHGASLYGLSVLGDDEQVLSRYQPDNLMLANGIGGIRTTERRRMVQTRLQDSGWRFVTVCHPSAIVSPRANIAESVQLFAGSIVQIGAVIGAGSIVNTGAVVEHDCDIGEYVHVAPGALLCGNVKVGEHSHVGAGAVVRQGVQLGPNTIVGAGAVVVENFSGCLLTGIPARPAGPKS
jgi:sugar O-acyltransferase (sialic acid O-acetyltransferase NeuD family)